MSGAAAAKSRCKGKGKETVETAHNGQQKVDALEEKNCVPSHDPENRRESQGQGKVRDRPAVHDGIPWKERPQQGKVIQERKTSQLASLLF